MESPNIPGYCQDSRYLPPNRGASLGCLQHREPGWCGLRAKSELSVFSWVEGCRVLRAPMSYCHRMPDCMNFSSQLPSVSWERQFLCPQLNNLCLTSNREDGALNSDCVAGTQGDLTIPHVLCRPSWANGSESQQLGCNVPGIVLHSTVHRSEVFKWGLFSKTQWPSLNMTFTLYFSIWPNISVMSVFVIALQRLFWPVL